MRTKQLTKALIALLTTVAFLSSCSQQGEKNTAGKDSTGNDSTAIAQNDSLPKLKGDDNINRATRFYAGISKDGITMSEEDAQSWQKYSKEINRLLNLGSKSRSMLDSLVKNDFKDFRDKVDLVFYPFSGADFLFPTTIFPDADTYILCGLENPGSPISTDIKTNYAHYQSYRKALSTFLQISYFITKDMAKDLDNNELDGTCPVLSMLMATAGYDIISIENKAINDDGELIDGGGNGNVMMYKFFKQGSNHEQTLYYISANVVNKKFEENVKKYFNKALSGHTVASYFKAASYLLHWKGFSEMLDIVLNNSQYIVGDDSGVPYKYLTENFDVTLYGTYVRPQNIFHMEKQPELDRAYIENADKVKPLPFRIGYSNPSNWQCSRRKNTTASSN